jgi:hypothetical protein
MTRLASEILSPRQMLVWFPNAYPSKRYTELSWDGSIFDLVRACNEAGDEKSVQAPPGTVLASYKTQKSAILNACNQMTPEIAQVRSFLDAGVMPPCNRAEIFLE